MALPPDFAWYPDWHCADRWCLRIGDIYGTEVVLVSERVDNSGWLTTINRHKEWEERVWSVLPTESLSLRMASRWAAFHRERLRAEVAAKRCRHTPYISTAANAAKQNLCECGPVRPA